jgi:hypothetical protein
MSISHRGSSKQVESTTHIRQNPSHQHTTQKRKKRFRQSRQDQVKESACALCPEITVEILLFGCRVDLFLLLGWLGREHVYRVLVRSIDIGLVRRHGHLDCVVAFAHLDDTQVRADLVIALRAPRNVAMQKEVRLRSLSIDCTTSSLDIRELPVPKGSIAARREGRTRDSRHRRSGC